MGTTLIQITDTEFKSIVKDAFIQGATLTREILSNSSKIIIDGEEYLSEEETLQKLNIKQSTLAVWRHKRKIKYTGKRGALCYSTSSIDSILNRQTIDTT